MIDVKNSARFRPLIWGFFFYSYTGKRYSCSTADVSVPSFGDSFFIASVILEESAEEKERFPSPHSGILFLFLVLLSVTAGVGACFRPLIRGFFFYLLKCTNTQQRRTVSVPSFGDSFFIKRWKMYILCRS